MMVKENYTNFATTTLATATITSGATTFAVSAGQGALFPLTLFSITMDTEILFIASRSTDTFTVGTRGFDNSTAASHTSGAVIQLCATAYNYNHLWQNVSDTYGPDMPPVHIGNTPSAYDAEFETGVTTPWVLFPSSGLPSGSIFAIGSSLKSCLLLHRSSTTTDTTLYTAYVPFTQTPPWVATCKVSHSLSIGTNSSNSVEVHFFVSDQTNPTASADSGNRIRVDSIISPVYQSAGWFSSNIFTSNMHAVRMLKDVSGTGTMIGAFVPISVGIPLYLRIACAASNVYTTYIGDGTTFWYLGTFTTTFTIQSLGFNFFSNNTTFVQNVAIDWVRVVTSTFPTYFGS